MSLKPTMYGLATILGSAALAGSPAVAADAVEAMRAEMVQKIAIAERDSSAVVRGREGWLFYVPELRTLTAGRFWGDRAASVSRALSKDVADPLPAILDFKSQLDSLGVKLLMVPVPAKATIYPDMLLESAPERRSDAVLLNDPAQQEFFDLLRKNGIDVLDLGAAFLAGRNSEPDRPLYCRQDTHWSPRGCEVAAAEISRSIGASQKWMLDIPRRAYSLDTTLVELKGDLRGMLADTTLRGEQVRVTSIRERTPEGLRDVISWRESPIILLGDSHNLVFSIGGDMLVKSAGLPELLAAALGFPLDVVAVRGSGATPARINLLRRRDNLAGKKLIIWCFTVREFTEGQGWRKVPVATSAPR